MLFLQVSLKIINCALLGKNAEWRRDIFKKGEGQMITKKYVVGGDYNDCWHVSS